MLRIEHEFGGAKVTNADAGNSNEFLRSILVEVATENYRQLMHEAISLDHSDGRIEHLDPPLRSNERIVSGLFANALSKVAARSRPEARIDRRDQERYLDLDQSDDGDSNDKAGRVDFLAWYGQRTFAIELKMATMNCETAELTEQVRRRWRTVVEQTTEAQAFLLDPKKIDPKRYPNPVSLALMVVVGRRAASCDKVIELDETLEEKRNDFLNSFKSLDKAPGFRAVYTFPQEFRLLVKRKKGHAVSDGDGTMYVPFVAFIARPVVNLLQSQRTST